MFQQYQAKGLVVLGVPSNDFGGQEPGSNEEIKTFCTRYKVTFPLAGKVKVSGDKADPLYRHLAEAAGPPQWNFTKYLVDRNGKVLKRFASGVAPEAKELREAIDRALQ
jgi:glutathione peroxidase